MSSADAVWWVLLVGVTAYAVLAATIEKLGREKESEIHRLHHHITETEKSHAAKRAAFAERAAALPPRRYQAIVWPPLTRKMLPVANRAASDTR